MPWRLTFDLSRFRSSFFFAQQVGNAAKLFSCGLQRFNLLSQLRLLGLLPAQYFMDVLHDTGPPDGTVGSLRERVNESGLRARYGGNYRLVKRRKGKSVYDHRNWLWLSLVVLLSATYGVPTQSGTRFSLTYRK